MELAHSLISFSLLIVEDEKTASDIMVRMLASKFPNCTIHTALNGIKGIEAFQQFTPDIVITDVQMPVMDGVEMIRKIKSADTNVSCIVMTAYSDRNNINKIGALGVYAYLMKPLDFDELFAAIEKCSAEIKPRVE